MKTLPAAFCTFLEKTLSKKAWDYFQDANINKREEQMHKFG
jgi:hypothetical protein